MTRLGKLVFYACALIVLVHAVASFFPGERLWGVNQLAYVPLVPRWIIIVLALLILIPRVNEAFYELLGGLFNLLERNLGKLNRIHKYILLGSASMVLFWVFRTQTHLLGDGVLRMNEIMSGQKFSITGPLDFYLHVLVYRILKLDVYQTYALVSCLAGAFFVFVALCLSHLLGREAKERVFAFMVLVSMGSIELFFGYVESYTLVYAGIAAYLLFSFWFLQGRCGLILPGMSLLFCTGLHLSAIYLLPSLVYLSIVKTKEKKTLIKNISAAMLVLLLVGMGLFVLGTRNPGKTGLAFYFISLFRSPENPYSFFSSAHLLDVINEQLLLSPLLIVFFFLIAFSRMKIDFKDRVVGFLTIMTISSVVFASLIDPKLGYARDWDLFSSTGLGYTLLGIYLIFGHFRHTKKKESNYALLALIFTALFSTLPWLYVNAQENKAVERFRNLLSVDVERSGYGHEILAYYYRDRGWVKDEMEQWEKAFSVIPNERYLGNLGIIYLRSGRYQEAANIFKKVIEMNPNSTEGYCNLGVAFRRMGEYDQAKKQYQMAIEKDPQFLPAYVNLGGALALTGDYQEALKVLNLVVAKNPDYLLAYYDLAGVYFRMGKPKDAITLLRAYLKRKPTDRQKIQEWLKKMNIELD